MIDGIRSNRPWWRLEQRLRQLAQKAAVLRNPRVYSYNQVAMRTHLEIAIRSLIKRKNYKVLTHLMDILHHGELETIPRHTTDGAPASPSLARRCLQTAAPRRSSATSSGLEKAAHVPPCSYISAAEVRPHAGFHESNPIGVGRYDTVCCGSKCWYSGAAGSVSSPNRFARSTHCGTNSTARSSGSGGRQH